MKQFTAYVTGLLLLSGCCRAAAPADLVNPLQGSDSSFEVSTGNTYPAVAVPWGRNFWTPQTGQMGSGWQYVYRDTTLCGFKQTHQPSPWINDYGCFSVMPVAGALRVGEKARASRFSHERELARPYLYRVDLLDYGIEAALTATNSGAVMRFDYPAGKAAYLVIDAFAGGSEVRIIPEERKVVGISRYYKRCNARALPENYACHFVLTFDRDFEAFGVWEGETVLPGQTSLRAGHAGAYLKFDTRKGATLTVRTASSFISPELAELHLEREIGDRSFERVMRASERVWNDELSRIRIDGGSDSQRRTFYTALYRTLLFPRRFHETGLRGDTVHWSALNGRTEPGPMYTDNGFWDTFRCVHPFFTLMYPALSGEIMQSLLNYYREGGWMPEWCSPGYNDCMIGQHSASLVADAYAKGIRGFDAQTAWEALEKGANNEGPVRAVGRDGCHLYNMLGYVPFDAGTIESVSKTLEYAYDDFCIARFGEMTGQPAEKTARYRDRARNYRNVFDPSIGFVRPRDRAGRWQEPYRPDTWGGSFTEGSAWHWTWCVYHDAAGLIRLMGGEERFIGRLDSVFTAEPTFEYSAYGQVIHEMTEMVLGGLGQYAHGNQPIQHGIYLYNHAGAPWKAQRWARTIMDTQYDPSQSGLCGDEDNGQTSCWYVFSALGFYPVTPGVPQYVIGSPLFPRAELALPGGRKFVVEAENNSPQNVYIQSATLDGRPFDRTWIGHDEITAGGTLRFVMGPEPNRAWGTGPGSRPYSMTAQTSDTP